MTAGSQRIALAGLAALAVAMGVGRFAFTPILPMMQGDAGLSVADGGWLASANYVGYLVGALWAGSIRAGTRSVLRTSLLAVAITTAAMGFTHGFAAWLALRALAGVASAIVLVFASAWCLEAFDRDASSRARSAATFFAGVGVGIAAAGLACLALMVAGRASDDAWMALGLAALLACMALWNSFGEAAAPVTRPAAPALEWNAESRRFVFCYAAFGFGYIVPATFVATMARATFPDPAVYGWSWPLFGAAAAASTFAATPLVRRFGDRAVWVGGYLLMAAGVLVPLVSRGLGGVVISALLVGGTFMVVTMVAMRETRRIAGPGARRLIAAMTSAFAAGQIAGPVVVAACDARGFGFGPALLAAGALLAIAAVALIPRNSLRTSP